MKYFANFPYTITQDSGGNSIVIRNLAERIELIPSIVNNPVLYYTYDIQDGDTPESIANKYYKDPYRYWIVLIVNNIINPLWQWPMSNRLFTTYLVNKYLAASIANGFGSEQYQVISYTQSTTYEYNMTTTSVSTDAVSVTTNENTIVIDSATYANTVPYQITCDFAQSSTLYSVDRTVISIYEWEDAQNESNRTIKLLDFNYVSKIESQLASLI